VVDWRALKAAFGGASLAQPQIAVRAARQAVKLEKSDALVHLVRDVGRVQEKAGARAALDGLRLADNPREMARAAKLAEKKGSKTRAILKLLGRGALMLTLGAFNLSLWVLGALFTLIGFVSSAKAAAERITLRRLQARKARRLLERERRLAAMTA
jgi:hypothetical protein